MPKMRALNSKKPSDCKAGARKSRPPWGKVAGVSLTEGGNSLTNIDCISTSSPSPTTAVQINRIKFEGPYNSASELPPHRALTGPPPTQRGRLAFINRLPTTSPPIPATAKQGPEKAVPLGGRGTASAVEGGNSLTNIDCISTSSPSPTTAVQINRIKSEGPYNSASELPPTEP